MAKTRVGGSWRRRYKRQARLQCARYSNACDVSHYDPGDRRSLLEIPRAFGELPADVRVITSYDLEVFDKPPEADVILSCYFKIFPCWARFSRWPSESVGALPVAGLKNN